MTTISLSRTSPDGSANFGFSASEAARAIRDWRCNFGRYIIPANTWSLIGENVEHSMYDKEAYEYAVATGRFHEPAVCKHSQQETDNSPDLSSSYLIRLEGPIADAEALRDFAALPSPPVVLQGTSNDNKLDCDTTDDDDDDTVDDNDAKAQFCLDLVDGKTRLSILRKLAELQSTFRPMFIRDSKAKKELAPKSLYPSIGIDTTLPQFRPHGSGDANFVPLHDMYPVWYFFYGHSRRRGRSFSAPMPSGRPTSDLPQGTALVDGGQNEIVRGSAYIVDNADDESVLRYHETDKYEVVRCDIEFEEDAEKVRGLTFRFRFQPWV